MNKKQKTKTQKKRDGGIKKEDEDALRSEYLCSPIRKFIQTHALQNFRFRSSLAVGSVVYPRESKINPTQIGSFVLKMVDWVSSLRWSSSESLSQPLEITIYLTPYQKVWSLTQKNIGPCVGFCFKSEPRFAAAGLLTLT